MSAAPLPASGAAGVSPASFSPARAAPDPGVAEAAAPELTGPPPPGPGLADTTAGPQGTSAGLPGTAAGGQPRRTDPFAVATLVFGILPLAPFALVTGLAALARTRRGRRAGRLAAVAGLVLAVAWLAAGSAVAAVLATRPAATPRPRLLHGTVFSLQAGQCANTAANGVAAAHAVPCAQPHDAEIYATFPLAGQSWPGTAALGQRARAGCLARVGSYLNPGLLGTSLTASYVYPDRGAWTAGVRTVVCEIRGTSGRLTGSVHGLGGGQG